ncbi:class II aldolase [Neobacillus sedimentimangrovi]|jgi:fructose-bisphosphate aldolase, class II|uniref:Class II aldolase n=1 Tax=Neobacillus sedimentimangrovi TaxID=2699460 RepID=A0ABS8QFG6_9BACI|nr:MULTISPECIES: class II fructose-bisphosphate aldolase [Neobacillus]AIM16966.1 fructose-bisphosphate aldolase [Bacillus sp. X1(2014)]MCD4837556.1 class II aldolase [Neobacillus sedimentimangrovi]MED3625374.1 class II aldolase [Neobacillus thermocopriae]MED3714070.1 class II aldolase [Neobacillus thermocopriae]
MPLVKMKEILDHAEKNQYGVGAFSVANMEMVLGAIRAAEELLSPLILQIAEVRLKHSPLHIIGPAMVAAAKAAKVPVAVHFDHGLTEEKIREALEIGFSSIMYDGSHHSLEENMKQTIKMAAIAREYGATVEAEIGQVAGSEDGSVDLEGMITSVEEAKQFVAETEVDALAVAIGNAHGLYKGEPNLRFDRLEELDREVKTPLVLHGGSGISEEDFRRCIRYGIRKINVATATFNKVIQTVNEEAPFKDYFSYHERMIEAAAENVKRHVRMFQSEGRVEEVKNYV